MGSSASFVVWDLVFLDSAMPTSVPVCPIDVGSGRAFRSVKFFL
jgi:hypothetical protein